MSNRLIHEKSPYLLQHAENPVDWHAWGEEAFARAEAEEKPIFLSIGYATCHWCHVMAHESFEDPEAAKILNERYISIKVDREERPDVDQVYMAACQVLTQQGGWPLSAWLTPDGKPFYVGTYFPRTSRFGRPGFIDVLVQLSDKWRSDPDIVRKAADQLTEALQQTPSPRSAPPPPDREILRAAFRQHLSAFDRQWGGFGQAPKFPTPHHLTFLLRWHRREGDAEALEMVEKTLQAMHRGGIFDHIGLGFCRYSVDGQWRTPHFEKMLYDQALLTMAYTEAYQVTGHPRYARVVQDILAYVLRDMTSPEGAFYAAEDADTEGREGLFYLWKPHEVFDVLGPELGALICDYYDISPEGNFEDGFSIPHVAKPVDVFARMKGLDETAMRTRLDDARAKLFKHRERRVHPLKDDKVLTAWNGLMTAALAKAGQGLEAPEYIRAATRAADFIMTRLMDERGRLLRRYRDGEAAQAGFLDDYAYLVWGLLELYEAAFDVRMLETALSLTRTMLDLFWDDQSGGFYYTGTDHEVLIARQKEVYDGALPSGNSVAAMNLLRLGRMTGDVTLEQRADELIKAFLAQGAAYPMAHTHFLSAVDFMLGPTQEMVLVGDPDHETARSMLGRLRRMFHPHKVLLVKTAGEPGRRLAAIAPFVESMHPQGGKSTLYVCQEYTCREPITEVAALDDLCS